MAHKYQVKKLVANHTTEQIDALLSYVATRLTMLGEMAEADDAYKTARKQRQIDLDQIDWQIMRLVDAIESGQGALPFDQVGEGNLLIEACPDCAGTGRVGRKKCATCDGTGEIPRSPVTSNPA